MSFGEAIKSGFRNYLMCSGRASRSEYWFWVLFTVLAGIGASRLGSVLGMSGALGGLLFVTMFGPSLAMSIRRLHDTGRSASWLLIGLPLMRACAEFISAMTLYAEVSQPTFIESQQQNAERMWVSGFITVSLSAYCVYVLTRPSEPGTNKYGPHP